MTDPIRPARFSSFRPTACLAALGLAFGPVLTAQGQSQSFGLGCAGSRGVLSLSVYGNHAIGGSTTYDVTGLSPSAPGWMVFGRSNRGWSGGTLPFDLSIIGAAPGCRLWVSPDLLLAAPARPTGKTSIRVDHPNDPTQVGVTLFSSYLSLDRNVSTPTPLVTSNGVATRIDRCHQTTAFDQFTAIRMAALSSIAYYDLRQGQRLGTAGITWEVIGSFDNSSTGVRGYIFRVVDRSPADVAVVFRGTSYGNVAAMRQLVDVRPSGGWHTGVARGFDSVAASLTNQAHRAVDAPQTRGGRVFFSGHSYGGSLATVAAYRMADGPVDRGVCRPAVALYSIGAPRVLAVDRAWNGDPRLVYDQKVPHAYAVTNRRDLATELPSFDWGYRHIRKQVQFIRECRLFNCTDYALRHDLVGNRRAAQPNSLSWLTLNFMTQHPSQRYINLLSNLRWK